MAKRLKLDVGPEYPYRMLGIASTLRDYQLAHILTRATRLDYRQEGEIEAHMSLSVFRLPLFAAQDKRNKVDYFLLPNKQDGQVVIVSERRFDYWLISGGDGEPELPALGKMLMQWSGIQFCYELDVSRLKEAEAFFTDLEMGTMKLQRRWRGRMREEEARW
ncbi:MAG: hypothetical protein IH599_06800 [Bacteroidales bacterium]|nr:hypothetical protein [Bacteroidales bacterium]